MKKSPILLLLLYFFFTLSLYANPDTDRLKFFDCLVRNDRSGWEDILVEMTQSKDSTNEKDLIEALYGYIGWSYRDDAKKEAGKWIPLFKNCLDRNTPGVLTLSEKYGYQAALLGFQILQTKSKAILLGPKCVSSADRSIQNDSCSAIGYIQKGNIEFFIPKVFGGSKKEGIRYYRQAESYLQNDPKNWQYLYLLCVILEYYIQEQSHDEAVEYYNKIRQIAPEMVWLQQFNESLRLSH